MPTVMLTAKYKNLNPGEFAGFDDAEAKYLTETKIMVNKDGKAVREPIGLRAVSVRATKPFAHDDVRRILTEPVTHIRADYDVGDFLVLLEEHAEKLAKAGLVEPLVAVRYRKDTEVDGAIVDKGVERNMTVADAKKHEAAGTVKVLRKSDD